MAISAARRTTVGAVLGTALTIAMSTMAFAPAFATPVTPTLTWNVTSQTINPGGSYVFGEVPAAPTCTAVTAETDVTASCVVTPAVTTVGAQTLTATATVVSNLDQSSATYSETLSYTVTAWTLKGFSSPVKMDAVNTVKAGSTVPLKFKVFAGTTRIKSKADVASFVANQVDCAVPATVLGTTDLLASKAKGHSLKYQAKAFHFNWKTPKLAKAAKVKGKKVAVTACYAVTMTTLDGSALTASFLLR